MKSIVAFAPLGLATAFNTDLASIKFASYVAKFGKQYNTREEFETRFDQFMKVDEDIERFNSEGNTWTIGHNQFSDWSQEELENILTVRTKPVIQEEMLDSHTLVTDVDSIDWRTKGYVPTVRD